MTFDRNRANRGSPELADKVPAMGGTMTAVTTTAIADHSACDNAGKQVHCDRCSDKYVCSPQCDFYCTPEGDHCCEPCLMAGAAVSRERGIVEALERWQKR